MRADAKRLAHECRRQGTHTVIHWTYYCSRQLLLEPQATESQATAAAAAAATAGSACCEQRRTKERPTSLST